MKKKSYLTRAVLAMVASGMLYANVGFAATETKSASDITSEYTLNKGDTLTLTGGVLAYNIVTGAQGKGDIILTAPLSVNTGVSITADIYGAKESGSTAIDGKNVNIVVEGQDIYIKEAHIIGGGYTDGVGAVTGNKVLLDSAESIENSFLRISAHRLTGGYNENETATTGVGEVTGNKVEINVGGTYTVHNIHGGKSKGYADVNNNEVNLKCGGYYAGYDESKGIHILGAESEYGSVSGNVVNIGYKDANDEGTSAKFFGCVDVTGGAADQSGNAINNKVVMTAPTGLYNEFNNTTDYGYTGENNSVGICGGGANGFGVAKNNVVDISNTKIYAATGTNEDDEISKNFVAGGASLMGTVDSNGVTISGSILNVKAGDIVAGGGIIKTFNATVTSPVVLGSANNNKVVMTDVQINGVSESYGSVYGGYMELTGFNKDSEAHKTALKTYYSDGGASGNTVEITTDKSAVFRNVFGGSTVTGDADNNIVKLSGENIVAEHHIIGGIAGGDYYDRAGVVASAHGNKVYLTGITTKRDVAGGRGTYHDENNAGSEANNNEVHINGGTYLNTEGKISGIVGGEAWSKAGGNITEIKNATVGVSGVVGGWIYSLAGTVTNNKVILDNVTFDFDGDNGHGGNGTFVAGGGCETDGTFTGTRSGNSLEIGSKGFTVNTGKAVIIQNFDSMTFADGATVTNNGTLTFGNNGDDEADDDVVWNAKIAGSGKVVVAGEFTLNNTISNSGGIEITEQDGSGDEHKLRVTDASYLATAVTNNGALNLYGGTLNQVVTNTAGTLKIKGDVATTGNMIVGGKLQVKGGGHLMLNNGKSDTLTVAMFEAYQWKDESQHEGEDKYTSTDNKISFDAGFTSVVDQVQATTYKGTITLGTVALTEGFDGEIGATKTYQLFTGSTDYTQFTINGTTEAVYDGFKYVFEDNGSDDGKLKVTKENGYSLHEVINNSDTGHVAGNVTSYSLNTDKTETEGLGTLTRVNAATPRELTINGNTTYKLLGNGHSGVTVNSGDSLTLKDLAEVSGFNGPAVVNNGILNLDNVVLKNAIAGSGVAKIDGAVSIDSTISNVLNIAATGTLDIVADKIGNSVENLGVVNLAGGTLNKSVTGTGTMNVNDDATFNAKVDNAVVVIEDKTLNVDASNIGGNVTNNGTVILGAGNLTKQITGGNVTTTGSVTTSADMLNNIPVLTNNAVLTLTGSTLNSNVGGAGNVVIAGNVFLGANVNQAINIASGSLTVNDAGNIGGVVNISSPNAELDLNGGILGQVVNGSGIVKNNGTVAIDSKVSVREINIVTGTTTANANNLNAVVNNTGTLNVSGGTFTQEVKGTGTLNVNGSVTANGNMTAGIVTVADGKSLDVKGNLNVGTIALNNTALTIAAGRTMNVTTALNMNGASTCVTVDKNSVLNDDLTVKTGMGGIINGTAGELALRMGGVNYTATQHKTAKDTLFTGGEAAKLTFKDANLVVDEATEQLTTGGTTSLSGNDLTISGAEATVVNKSDGSKIEEVGAQENKTVTVTQNNSTDLVEVDKITFNNATNLTAQDMQIKKVKTSGNNLVIVVSGNSILSLGASAKGIVKNANSEGVTTEVQVDSGSTFNIGQEEAKVLSSAGRLEKLTVTGDVNIYHVNIAIGTIVLNGGVLWVDPSYQEVSALNFASGGVGIDTDGSVMNVGMDYGKLNSALASAGISCNGDRTVNAHYGVAAFGDTATTTLDLSGKHLVVDDTYGTPTAELKLGNGGVLAIASKSVSNSGVAAIKVSDSTKVDVDSGADLIVVADDFKVGASTYKVIEATTGNFTDNLWKADNIYASDPTYKLVFDVDSSGSSYVLRTDWNKVEGIFGETTIAAPNMYNRILQKAAGTEANVFLKAVINKTAGAGSTDATKAVGAAALNAVVNMGEAAGVQHGAVSMVGQIGDALASNMSLASRPTMNQNSAKIVNTANSMKNIEPELVETGSVRTVMPSVFADKKYDKQIWASYMHNKETVDGLKLDKLNGDYIAQYNGATVGADLWSSAKAVGGVSVAYTTGNVNGNTGGASTRNKAKYCGFNIYNRVDMPQNSVLLYDAGYMNAKNEITQFNNGTEITADAKVDVITAGARYEKLINTGKSAITPFAGLRYVHLKNNDYTNSLGMNISSDNQNIFMPSIGIGWNGDFEIPNSVWTWRPSVETGYVWNLGNRNTEQMISFGGASDPIGYDIADKGNYYVRVGMNFVRSNFVFGFAYKYQRGSTVRNDKWNINLNWKF